MKTNATVHTFPNLVEAMLKQRFTDAAIMQVRRKPYFEHTIELRRRFVTSLMLSLNLLCPSHQCTRSLPRAKSAIDETLQLYSIAMWQIASIWSVDENSLTNNAMNGISEDIIKKIFVCKGDDSEQSSNVGMSLQWSYKQKQSHEAKQKHLWISKCYQIKNS